MSVLRASLLRWTLPLHTAFQSARGMSVMDLAAKIGCVVKPQQDDVFSWGFKN